MTSKPSTRKPAKKTVKKPLTKRPAGKVTERPARCPRAGCGSTRRTKKQSIITRHIKGVLDGEPYTHVKNSRVQCKDCGTIYGVNSYVNEPDGAT